MDSDYIELSIQCLPYPGILQVASSPVVRTRSSKSSAFHNEEERYQLEATMV